MARWALVVEPVTGPIQTVEFLSEVDGDREEAEAALQQHMRHYSPRHPMSPRRVRIYRMSDGFLMICEGALGKLYPHHFRLCELEWDSGKD